MERMRVRRELACFCVDGGFLATLIGKVAEIRYQLGSLPDDVSVKYDTIFDPIAESIEMRAYLEEFETDEEYAKRVEEAASYEAWRRKNAGNLAKLRAELEDFRWQQYQVYLRDLRG